jgi:Fur family ferric uptake transcriptional regulator
MKERLATKHRQLLLGILREADGHLDAKEIFRRAADKDPGISLATVYRNLQLFEELGLVDGKRLERTGCWYEIRRAGHHCDVACSMCGRVIEFESPVIRQLLDEVQSNSSFTVTKAVLYLEGYCEECADRAKTIDSPSSSELGANDSVHIESQREKIADSY